MPPATPAPGSRSIRRAPPPSRSRGCGSDARDDVHPVAERGLQRLRLLLRGAPVLRLHGARPLEPQQRQDRPTSRGPARPPGTGGRPSPGPAGRRWSPGSGPGRPRRGRRGRLRRGRRASPRRRHARRSRRRRRRCAAVRWTGRGGAARRAPKDEVCAGSRWSVVDQVRSARLRGLDVGGPGPVVVDEEHHGRYGRPVGSSTVAASVWPPRASPSTSRKPGPPSDMGASTRSSCGAAADQPAGHRLRRLPGGQRPGEPGRGEDDTHTVMLACPVPAASELRCVCRSLGAQRQNRDRPR